MSNREQKLTTTLGKKLKQPQLREKRSRRARSLRALNLPTTETGSLKTAENGSLSDDGHNQANGCKRIQFTAPDGKRKTMYLGKVSKRDAESLRLRVESLLSARVQKKEPDRDTAFWLAEIESVLLEMAVRKGATWGK